MLPPGVVRSKFNVPPFSSTVPLPTLALLVTVNVPPLTVVPPVYVSVPEMPVMLRVAVSVGVDGVQASLLSPAWGSAANISAASPTPAAMMIESMTRRINLLVSMTRPLSGRWFFTRLSLCGGRQVPSTD